MVRLGTELKDKVFYWNGHWRVSSPRLARQTGLRVWWMLRVHSFQNGVNILEYGRKVMP